MNWYGNKYVPIGGEFVISYEYYIPIPTDGTKPEDYGQVTAVIPKTGGAPRGSFETTNFVKLENTRVSVNVGQEGVTVQKTERYVVQRDPFDRYGGTRQINYRIAVKNPKTGNVVDISTIQDKSGVRGRRVPEPITVIAIPKR